MPAGRPSSPDSPQHPEETPQTKRCTACQGPLNVDTALTAPYAPESSETINYCSTCRETRNVPRSPFTLCATIPGVEDGACDIDIPRRVLRNSRNGNFFTQINARHESESSGDEGIETLRLEKDSFVLDTTRQNIPSVSHGDRSVPVPTSTLQHAHAQYIPSSPPLSPSHLLAHPTSPIHRQSHSQNASSGETHSSHSYDREQDSAYPDPLTDITRLRVRSKGYKCLQPGATFKGTQKSGRNSYDVNVTIVDVDFASSFLCGYLRIRGLTDDWPELTTYFDAQIIGMRHGFDTQDWGASRQEDTVHWARFPAFRAMQKDLLEPRLTLPANTSRPAVFMRWKERFLVPDHRVQDISGASFAGFYYVCVEFNPESQPASLTPEAVPQDFPSCVENGFAPYTASPVHDPRLSQRRSVNGGSTGSVYESGEPPAASMSGFYFHQNSEPYQQLSLTHVQERFHSSFEFR